MLSGDLWPAHPHPYFGECLSSWMVRTSHHNGLKVQAFSDIVFGNDHQIWNRDIDRLAPYWLLNIVSRQTATTLHDVNKTILRRYLNRLFSTMPLYGVLRWVLPLVIHHRKHTAFGMQYCPLCLAEDKEPYYRLAWRLAIYTFCPIHHVMMRDRCQCGASINFHRIELGKTNLINVDSLDKCWQCEEKLSDVPVNVIDTKPISIFNIWNRVLGVIDRGFINSGPINYDRLILLHQVCKIISSKRFNQHIQKYICVKSGLPFILIRECTFFEQYSVSERHYILMLAWWLLGNTPRKLQESLKRKAIVTNHLYRDSSERYLHDMFGFKDN